MNKKQEKDQMGYVSKIDPPRCGVCANLTYEEVTERLYVYKQKHQCGESETKFSVNMQGCCIKFARGVGKKRSEVRI